MRLDHQDVAGQVADLAQNRDRLVHMVEGAEEQHDIRALQWTRQLGRIDLDGLHVEPLAIARQLERLASAPVRGSPCKLVAITLAAPARFATNA